MKVGILTSGGDAPGINATIRGVGKTAINNYGMQMIGIQNGFSGLLHKDVVELSDQSLSGILNLGGTILGTAIVSRSRMLTMSWSSIALSVLAGMARSALPGCSPSWD